MGLQHPILIIEDEPRLRRDIARGLEAEGHRTCSASSIAEAQRLNETVIVSAVVLDRMLPDGDGLQWLREFRSTCPTVPAIVLTARDAVSDRVAGLDSGADDYLVKPFAFAELLARLRAVLRRSSISQRSEIHIGTVTVDFVSRRLLRQGSLVELTPRQAELIGYLARNIGRAVSREELLREVWNEPTMFATNVVEVSVNHLRRKLSREGWPELIETVRGEGYRMREEI